MSKLINADELEPDTEWSDYYDGFVSFSQSQINEAEEVKAIPLEKVEQAREEIENWSTYDGIYIDRADVLSVLDKLIEEVEE
ncbi:hypothetical protein SAMN05216391_10818 [Lachnospiraceae bacterium KHCPX20]|jgi:hypothetical protein|nr:hypothetical protein SAMN05216391_10818 [Lachnospiraceae bacterium KHCPX20]